MSTTHNSKHRCLSLTHDSVNFSPSKQKYSFSKGSRFKSISGATPSDFNHHLPGTFGRRSPSFGIGDRFKQLRKPCKSIMNAAAKPSLTPSKRNICSERFSHRPIHFRWGHGEVLKTFQPIFRIHCQLETSPVMQKCSMSGDQKFVPPSAVTHKRSYFGFLQTGSSSMLLIALFRGAWAWHVHAFVLLWLWEEQSYHAQDQLLLVREFGLSRCI